MFKEETTFSAVDHPAIPDNCPECGGQDAEKEVVGETEFMLICDSCGGMVSNE